VSTIARVSPRALVLSAVFVVAVVLGGMLFGLSLERAALLAPVLVIVAGGVAFLVVLWAKVIRDSVRGRG
jgi:hypothetical protein